MKNLSSILILQLSMIIREEGIYECGKSDVFGEALTQIHGTHDVQLQRKLWASAVCKWKEKPSLYKCKWPAYSMKSHFTVEIKFNGKLYSRWLIHTLWKKIPANCVNNVAPLITLAGCKKGLVLMLERTAWNIQIEVSYIRQGFLIFFFSIH